MIFSCTSAALDATMSVRRSVGLSVGLSVGTPSSIWSTAMRGAAFSGLPFMFYFTKVIEVKAKIQKNVTYVRYRMLKSAYTLYHNVIPVNDKYHYT